MGAGEYTMNFVRTILAFLRPAFGIGDAIGGAGGITSGILGLGEASHMPSPNYWTPGASVEMDEKWYRAMQAIEKSIDRNTGMVDPTILASYSRMLGIDLQPLVQATGLAGGLYGGMASKMGGFGDVMTGQAGQAFGRGEDIYRTAADPENALRDYIKGKVVEDTRAADTARGVAMSPYSAGNEADALRKFEMDWQDRMLGRKMAGGSAADASLRTGAGALSGATGYYGMQPELTMASASTPIAGQEFAYGRPMDYATQFTQAQGANVVDPYSRIQSQINPYLGLSAQMGPQMFADQRQFARDRFNYQQGGINDIFKGAQMLNPYAPMNPGGPTSAMGMTGGTF